MRENMRNNEYEMPTPPEELSLASVSQEKQEKPAKKPKLSDKIKISKKMKLIIIAVACIIIGIGAAGLVLHKVNQGNNENGGEATKIIGEDGEEIEVPARPENPPVYSYTGRDGVDILDRFEETFPGMVVLSDDQNNVVSVDGYEMVDGKRWVLYLDGEVLEANPRGYQTNDNQIYEWHLE